jgi:hypothetical protein
MGSGNTDTNTQLNFTHQVMALPDNHATTNE